MSMYVYARCVTESVLSYSVGKPDSIRWVGKSRKDIPIYTPRYVY